MPVALASDGVDDNDSPAVSCEIQRGIGATTVTAGL